MSNTIGLSGLKDFKMAKELLESVKMVKDNLFWWKNMFLIKSRRAVSSAVKLELKLDKVAE